MLENTLVKIFKLAFIAAVIQSYLVWGQAFECTDYYIEGKDTSSIIAFMPTQNVQACGRICSLVVNCKYYTFEYQRSYCLLLESPLDFLDSNDYSIVAQLSITQSDSNDYSIVAQLSVTYSTNDNFLETLCNAEYDKAYVGDDITTGLGVNNVIDCQNMCNLISECKYYSFTGTCQAYGAGTGVCHTMSQAYNVGNVEVDQRFAHLFVREGSTSGSRCGLPFRISPQGQTLAGERLEQLASQPPQFQYFTPMGVFLTKGQCKVQGRSLLGFNQCYCCAVGRCNQGRSTRYCVGLGNECECQYNYNCIGYNNPWQCDMHC